MTIPALSLTEPWASLVASGDKQIETRSWLADVPFFFKQWGGRTPTAGGRLLNGRTWDEFPETERIGPVALGLEGVPA